MSSGVGLATTRVRRGARFPLWAGSCLVVFLTGFALGGRVTSLAPLAPWVNLVGALGACGAASWSESRLYYAARARRRHRIWAAAFGLAIVALAVVALLDRVAKEHAYSGALLFVGTIGCVWFASAWLGSALIVVLDAGASAILRSLESRVRALVLTLLALACVVALSVAPRLFGLLSATPEGGTAWWSSTGLTGELAARLGGVPGVAVITRGSSAGLLFVFAITLLVGLPAVSSATAKFAGLVMERIHPLIGAFDAVARGERAVRVDEGGGREFAQLGSHFNRMVETLATAERMERAFGSYMSAQLLARIREQHGEAEIQGSVREASVFFADIRGFTTMSEQLSAEQIVQVLNVFFARAVEVVDAHEGYLNKFLGDALMVVFNGPLEQPDHCLRVVRCAIALQQVVEQLNAERAFPHVGTIRVGVGVASGPMVCGNVGSARQMEYTVIGDVVNTASRLCSLAAGGEVWMTRSTVDQVGPSVDTRPLPPLQLKGKEDAVEVWAWPA